MKIETFTVCYNEEKLLPYFLKHYLQYGSVTIFDNQSTDRSRDIAREAGAIIFEFDSGNQFREDILTHIRNSCWKESKADWVIVTDVDELLYHNNLVWALSKSMGTVLLPRMFNMYSESFPTTKGQIYEEVNMGVEFRSKLCIFRPDSITEMNYDAGCHFARPEGNFILNVKTDIINLHFKNLSTEYAINRNKELCARQSEENNLNNWNWHTAESAEETIRKYNEIKPFLMKIL